MAGAMLDCAVCGTRKWQTFEAEHGEELRQAGATRLPCSSCARETYWYYAQHDSGAAPERKAPAPPPSAVEAPASAMESAADPAAERGSAKQETLRSHQSERRTGLERRARPRRGNRRVALQMPVRIRASSRAAQFEEVTRTVNVSRNGIYLQSEQPYSKGLQTLVVLNYSAREGGAMTEQKGTVVRVVDSEGGARARGVAIQLQ